MVSSTPLNFGGDFLVLKQIFGVFFILRGGGGGGGESVCGDLTKIGCERGAIQLQKLELYT